MAFFSLEKLSDIWRAENEAARWIAPGTQSMTIHQRGDYQIWHEFVGFYEGNRFSYPQALPASARIRVEDLTNEGSLALASGDLRVESNQNAERSLFGYFRVEEAPTRILISVQGNFPPRPFVLIRDTRHVFASATTYLLNGLIFSLLSAFFLLGAFFFFSKKASPVSRKPAREGDSKKD